VHRAQRHSVVGGDNGIEIRAAVEESAHGGGAALGRPIAFFAQAYRRSCWVAP
jgi:hypothetical protein